MSDLGLPEKIQIVLFKQLFRIRTEALPYDTEDAVQVSG